MPKARQRTFRLLHWCCKIIYPPTNGTDSGLTSQITCRNAAGPSTARHSRPSARHETIWQTGLSEGVPHALDLIVNLFLLQFLIRPAAGPEQE